MRSGPRQDPYSWTYTLAAGDKQTAIELAVAEFEAIARLSQVGWVRKVIAVEVDAVE